MTWDHQRGADHERGTRSQAIAAPARRIRARCIASEVPDPLGPESSGQVRVLRHRRHRDEICQAGVLAGHKGLWLELDSCPLRPAKVALDLGLDDRLRNFVEVQMLEGVVDPAEGVPLQQERRQQRVGLDPGLVHIAPTTAPVAGEVESQSPRA
jgi:hypothetical protein